MAVELVEEGSCCLMQNIWGEGDLRRGLEIFAVLRRAGFAV